MQELETTQFQLSSFLFSVSNIFFSGRECCFFKNIYVFQLISFLSCSFIFLSSPLFFPLRSPSLSLSPTPHPSSLQFYLIHMVLDKLAAKDLGKVSRCPVKKSHQGVHFFPISSYYTTQLHSRGKIMGNLHSKILG